MSSQKGGRVGWCLKKGTSRMGLGWMPSLKQQSEEEPPCQLPWEEQKSKQTKVEKRRVEWVPKKGDELNGLNVKSKNQTNEGEKGNS